MSAFTPDRLREVEASLLERVISEPSARCEVRKPFPDACRADADWALPCPSCGDAGLLCSPHRAELDQWVADGGDTFCCRSCSKTFPLPLAWRPV